MSFGRKLEIESYIRNWDSRGKGVSSERETSLCLIIMSMGGSASRFCADSFWQGRKQILRRFSGILRHQRINKDKCSHGFHDRHSPRYNAWVMPSFRLQDSFLKSVA